MISVVQNKYYPMSYVVWLPFGALELQTFFTENAK